MRVFLTSFLIFCSLNIFAQQDSTIQHKDFYKYFKERYGRDTVHLGGLIYRVTDFAIDIKAGAIKYIHDIETEKYFGNYWTAYINIAGSYKNFFVSYYYAVSDITIKQSIYFPNEFVAKDKIIAIHKLNTLIGYTFELKKEEFSIAPYFQFSASFFQLSNVYYFPEKVGYGYGFSINKYFKLRSYRYLTVFIDNSFITSNYDKFNPLLGNKFYSISFGVGYRTSFFKRD